MDNNQFSQATQSFLNFTKELEQFDFLISFLKLGNNYISDNLPDAKKKLMEIYKKDGEDLEFFKNNSERLLQIDFYEQNLSRIIYVRAIDNFINYFKDILAEIVLKKPEVLKSKDQERIDFIIEHQTMEDLIKSISEKKIEELFYKGLKEIIKFFNDRLGITLFSDKKREKEINLLVKQRNLVVHNRGKINKEIIREFPEEHFLENYYLDFKFDYVIGINKILYQLINELDFKLSKKFDLYQISY